MQFRQKLDNIVHKNNSLLCIGLDIDIKKIPKFLFDHNRNPFLYFNKKIIDYTKDVVCSYKLNLAFYEVLGEKSFNLIKKTREYIPNDIFVILDGKKNDIGNTAKKYAEFIFKKFKCDATTINPYLGRDGVQPFLDYTDKCSFILCRTSNKSAGEFQDLKIDAIPLYQKVAEKIREWNLYGNCGAVVGATYPNELKNIRSILGDSLPILIPGIGKQGGDVKKTVKQGINNKGEMAIINSSRSIIFADQSENFADEARKTAVEIKNEINKYR
jgi:orotidine-5'-phosphate decarboxylase